jgi:hypothetical protein
VALTVGSNTVDLTWQAERMSTQGSNRNPDWWRLGRPSDVIPVPPVDTSWGLFQNFPNPFDSTTTFQFVLARPARVSLEIATLSGDKIDEVMGDHLMPAGTFRLLYAPGTFLGANAVR